MICTEKLKNDRGNIVELETVKTVCASLVVVSVIRRFSLGLLNETKGREEQRIRRKK